jgi:2-methylcitrate dehydratase PrpD
MLTGEEMMRGYLERVATFICQFNLEAAPEGVVSHSKLVLLDTIGAIMKGSGNREVQSLAGRLGSNHEPRRAVVIGTRMRADPHVAALINGAAGTWDELDEGHAAAKGHPGIHVVPAALALAESCERSGAELLESIIVGYEVAAATGKATTLRDGFHAHGTWGTLGSAAASAKLAGFGEKKIREAINIASALTVAAPYQAAVEGATVRNLFAGMSNCVGVLAMELCGSGLTGQVDAPRNVFALLSGTEFDSKLMADGLGKHYQILRNYFKVYPCCRHTHACIEAALAFGKLSTTMVEEIEKVTVETYDRAALMCAGSEASNQLAARFSIPFIVASTLLRGNIDIDTFAEAERSDQVVRELASKITVHEDSSHTAERPRYRTARIIIDLRSGRKLSQVGTIDEDADETQIPAAQVREKFRSLTSARVGADRGREILAAVERIETISDVRELTKLLVAESECDLGGKDGQT